MLIEDGALVPPDADRTPTRGWADPVEHARMLHDDRRTNDYVAAVRAAVRPADIVLDIGTGSGVLAIAAARAGARHVYAVEASDIADVAERVFASNDVQDKVTLIRGWSRDVELPERADVLVAEVIGNEPFEEEILETTLDARRRLLKPDARLIPHTLELVAHPLLIPDDGGQAARDRLARHPTVATALRDRVPTTSRRRLPWAGEQPDRSRGSRPMATGRSADHPRDGAARTLRTAHRRRVRCACRRGYHMGERNRRNVSCAPTWRRRPHARSLEVAVLELGDLGVGASRRLTSGGCRHPAGALLPPGAGSGRRIELRRFALFG